MGRRKPGNYVFLANLTSIDYSGGNVSDINKSD